MTIQQDILIEQENGIIFLTLNRPEKLNALRSQMIEELSSAIVATAKNRSIRVIVLKGAGRAFSVGGDIWEMQKLDRRTGRLFIRRLMQLARVLLKCPTTIIAQVDGYCLGGGNELQLFCDLTIASDRSVFGQLGPKVGSAPLWGGTQILPLLVGIKKAKEIMFLCHQYSAAEALSMGWINRVVPLEELDRTVEAICDELKRKSPQSIRLIKKALHRPLLTAIEKDMKLLEKIYGTAELREGMRAFLEKREPTF